ncbi:transporter substrate-binding domain-containing protein [Prolixibacteraceae bacterium Z1-6]|uniref:Transporter substrate-binding domain-containing protein n=1 Tax=Draconibacterium aestuarii TaxID=2998507 RepID=A0A9X3F7I6_9BACT|nr:transporter substrate-binding domain-containing protein [Prolixibacteraceae bacterium Z1-6]
MTKLHLSYIIPILLTLLISCNSDKKNDNDTRLHPDSDVVKRDLDDIRREGVLNVLTTYSSTSYFLYKGQPMGYEYEMLKHFSKYLGVDLNMVVSNDIDTMHSELNLGEVDLIAHGLTVTRERRKHIEFSDYLYLTYQVLVQKKPDNWRTMHWRELHNSTIHDPIELIGDTVSVRANSSYINRLANLSDELGGEIYIDTLPGYLSTNKIIEMVASGEIKYTVADNNIASINASYYPVLDTRVPISFSQQIAWAMRKNSPQLKRELNKWLRMMKKEAIYNVIYNKYFENEKNFRRRVDSDFYSLNNSKISEYDDLIKIHAQDLGWDWRLMASQIYQESRFNPESESWAGAQGLMQMMPTSAKYFDVDDRTNPEKNLEGGTKMLKLLWNRFEEVPDSVQRIKLTLAAYNSGYGHVVDAQKLADSMGVKRDTWDGNVEEMMLKLSYPENYNKPFIDYGYVRGIEPVTYVKQIFSRYDHYVQFIE